MSAAGSRATVRCALYDEIAVVVGECGDDGDDNTQQHTRVSRVLNPGLIYSAETDCTDL